MSFNKIVKGDYGQVAQITFIDIDTDAAADISAYTTTIEMIFTSPTGAETAKTATFESDGTDGVIEYTIETGLFSSAGGWAVRGQVTSGSAKLSTIKHNFIVLG